MDDGLAAIIVTLMLVPQSLAYAMLAGLPPQSGLYASILPLLAYALLGSSNTLAVGPVAILSLMTAAATAQFTALGYGDPVTLAMTLALLSGAFLALAGALRLGFIADFISHPVMIGFISASGVLIALGQAKHLLGLSLSGQNLLEIIPPLLVGLGDAHRETMAIGLGTLASLLALRRYSASVLLALGAPKRLAAVMARAAPVLVVIVTTLICAHLDLAQRGVRIVGSIEAAIPTIALPDVSITIWIDLVGASALIALVGFVESVAVAGTLARRRGQQVSANQELTGLGAANIAAGLSGGYPVTGGFARSAVNFDAGARTPAAGAFTALGILGAVFTLTPALYYLPQATLAATIIMAVLSLVDVSAFSTSWTHHRRDFWAMAGTALATLLIGVEVGIILGLVISVGFYLRRTSRPVLEELNFGHQAGRLSASSNSAWKASSQVRLVSIADDLYFANACHVETKLTELAAASTNLSDLVLAFSAGIELDMTSIEMLERLDGTLGAIGIELHLSGVSPELLQTLNAVGFINSLSGQVFSDTNAAYRSLTAPLEDPAAAI
ncbi:MAG: SulP family inorganic anion transporter [Pseudomonadota bacterium]